jgi:hypothetical protein
MIQRTNKIFIGKDINRTAAITDGMAVMSAVTTGYGVSTGYVANGEILVLDKYKKVLGVGATISDTDVIYICQGLGTSFSIANEAGTAITGYHLRMSDPIDGKNVKNWNGKAYVAKAEQTTTLDFTAVAAFVVGTEYIIRIIYRDIWEHPGQYTATYRYTPTVTTLATVLTALAAKINAHSGRRVSASATATTLVLTGLPIPQCTTGVNDLDPFTMVEFVTDVDYVNSSGYWTSIGLTSNTVVEPVYGTGNWENVRDIERAAWGYLGITNRTHYPIILPDVMTDATKTYNIYTIEHDNAYLSPDNQYVKHTPITTQIAFVVPSSGNQKGAVLGVLNSWMESLQGQFAPVTV